MREIKNIIFDLGGVILNIDYNLTEQAFIKLGLPNFHELYNQYHSTKIFDQLETGEITEEAFIDQLQRHFPDHIKRQQVRNAWNAMLLDVPESRLKLIASARKNYHCYLLSNTNAIHLKVFHQKLEDRYGLSSFDEVFEKAYYSNYIGLRKPDKAAYQYVLKENNIEATETLFIDDSPQNIEGAKKAGLHTFYLKKPKQVEELFEKGKLIN